MGTLLVREAIPVNWISSHFEDDAVIEIVVIYEQESLLEVRMNIFTFSHKLDDFHTGIETFQFFAESPEMAQRMAKEFQESHNARRNSHPRENPPLNIDFHNFTQSPVIEGFLDPDLAIPVTC